MKRHYVYVCSCCGSMRVQSTAWIDANRQSIISDDSPHDDVYCPRCDTETGYKCLYRCNDSPHLWRCDHTKTEVPLRTAIRNAIADLPAEDLS